MDRSPYGGRTRIAATLGALVPGSGEMGANVLQGPRAAKSRSGAAVIAVIALLLSLVPALLAASPAAAVAANPVSDDFHTGFVNPAVWSFNSPRQDGTAT